MTATQAGYYGQPVIKPPVWTWEVPLYFFVGGMAGMAAVIALPSLALRASIPLARSALWLAAAGMALAPLLLIKDLGRPRRFYNMLRVFKPQSAMSVGAWILVVFSAFVAPALALVETFDLLVQTGIATATLSTLLVALLAGAALSGALLATYTGVLLGATVVPAWFLHRRLLPMHFGVASLGSAASALMLAGYATAALRALLLGAAALEALLALLIESRRHGDADRALRHGGAGAALRISAICTGPVAFGLLLAELVVFACVVFLSGALLGRYAWLWAGRASANDPRAVFAAEES